MIQMHDKFDKRTGVCVCVQAEMCCVFSVCSGGLIRVTNGFTSLK